VFFKQMKLIMKVIKKSVGSLWEAFDQSVRGYKH
jgi:hypothetical protein